MIEAFRQITKPYILMMNGDWTNPPEYADAMLEPLVSGRADHVIGDRPRIEDCDARQPS